MTCGVEDLKQLVLILVRTDSYAPPKSTHSSMDARTLAPMHRITGPIGRHFLSETDDRYPHLIQRPFYSSTSTPMS